MPKKDADGNVLETADGFEILELVSIAGSGSLTDKEQRAYDVLKHIVEDPNTTAQVIFVNKDSAIEFGSYRDQKIDLYEIKWLDKNPAAQVRSA